MLYILQPLVRCIPPSEKNNLGMPPRKSTKVHWNHSLFSYHLSVIFLSQKPDLYVYLYHSKYFTTAYLKEMYGNEKLFCMFAPDGTNSQVQNLVRPSTIAWRAGWGHFDSPVERPCLDRTFESSSLLRFQFGTFAANEMQLITFFEKNPKRIA